MPVCLPSAVQARAMMQDMNDEQLQRLGQSIGQPVTREMLVGGPKLARRKQHEPSWSANAIVNVSLEVRLQVPEMCTQNPMDQPSASLSSASLHHLSFSSPCTFCLCLPLFQFPACSIQNVYCNRLCGPLLIPQVFMSNCT